MHYSSEIQSSDKFEVISVADERHKTPHFLLLLTKQSVSIRTIQEEPEKEQKQEKRYLNGTIDIQARYLWGPLSQEIGNRVCHMGGKTSFNEGIRLSNGDILVEITKMHGLKVASFMLNRIVCWAKFFEAERKVQPFKLVPQDATNIDNRARRNQLYRKFGMRLVFDDPATEESGHSAHDLVVGELLTFSDREWANISVDNWLEGFRALESDRKKTRERLRESLQSLRYFKRRSKQFTVKAKMVRQALHHIVNWPLLVVTAVVAYGVGAGQWRAYLTAAKQLVGL